MSTRREHTEESLTRTLTYAGFILVVYELVKSMIVKPVKSYYDNTIYGEGMPFNSYEKDVMSRSNNQFEASLLYLRDFMEALDSEDVLAIQALRTHRNELAHNLPLMLSSLDVHEYIPLLEKVDRALYKLSNYHTYVEIGSEPELQGKDIDWDSFKGAEYLLFEEVLGKVRALLHGGL